MDVMGGKRDWSRRGCCCGCCSSAMCGCFPLVDEAMLAVVVVVAVAVVVADES